MLNEQYVLAASKKKHLLLEKPAALDLPQLDQILEACQVNGVQFMDGTMWYHHPRTVKMKQIISNSANFGHSLGKFFPLLYIYILAPFHNTFNSLTFMYRKKKRSDWIVANLRRVF